jgi:hypothetical protein
MQPDDPALERLRLELHVPDADAEELDSLTSRVRRELLALDVDAVERPQLGPAPANARAPEIATVGALIVSVLSTPAVLQVVVDTLRSWASRGEARSVKLTLGGDSIELTGASGEDQRRLVAAWIRKHGAG